MERILSFMVRQRLVGGFLLALVFLWAARPHPWTLAAGGAVTLAGVILRTWASGHIRKGRALAVTGPYSLVRNPLYLGSFVIAAGFCLMGLTDGWRPLLAVLYAALFALVYGRKMRQEERQLAGKYLESFEDYRRRVPLFWPRLARPVPGEGFDWKLVMRHWEYQLWLGLLAMAAVLFLKMRLGLD